MKSSFPYPHLNRRLLMPLEEQLTQALKHLITNRDLTHRYELPTIHEMASELGISAEVVTVAYQRLLDEKLILVSNPESYHVNFQPLPSTYYTKLSTIFEVIKNNHMSPVMETIVKEVIDAKDYPLLPNPWSTHEKLLHLTRLYKGNEIPIVYLEAYFPLSLFPNIENLDFTRFPLFRITDEFYHQPIAHYRHLIQAVPLPATVAEFLHSETATATLSTVAHAYNAKNQLIYISIDWAYSHYSYQQVLDKIDFQEYLD